MQEQEKHEADASSTENQTGTAEEGGAVDVMPSIEEQLRIAEQQAAEHHDAWLRAKAETENMRRRAQEDVAKAHKYAVEKFAGELLSVKDTLEMALADTNPESMRAGVEMTLKNLVAAFERSGVTEVNPMGDKFDPHRHQAVAMIEADAPANTVVQVMQKGYLIAERTLRPAMVVVARNQE